VEAGNIKVIAGNGINVVVGVLEGGIVGVPVVGGVLCVAVGCAVPTVAVGVEAACTI
jgi:hypothetical protein